ncbi:MaoC family dehydratase [Leisingera sp. NJS204]|uniref:MaoC family dehydratase n=1 Tax=Leisingera sp. NJS204 TaxID=2508307 RepID=UPI001012911B|nr:MaoC family dehydratase [Leisingera sp. NJS204]QAX30759.1 MaoC family dehydratase [Leisingera sp. NJS204]
MAIPEGYSLATMAGHVGHEFGASAPIVIDQARINAFANCTEDQQWIHVDVERAERESPFGGPIAHGFLCLSLIASALQEIGVFPGDASGVMNYGLDKVRFTGAVPAGATVRVSVTLTGVEPKGDDRLLVRTSCTVAAEGAEAPAVFAEALALVFV